MSFLGWRDFHNNNTEMSFSLTTTMKIIGWQIHLITGYLNPYEGKDLRHVLMLVARVPSKQGKVRLKNRFLLSTLTGEASNQRGRIM